MERPFKKVVGKDGSNGVTAHDNFGSGWARFLKGDAPGSFESACG
jgi:hypothetical protein